MGWQTKIKFRGQEFIGFRSLVGHWNLDKPEFVHCNARNVSQRIRNWQKAHPKKVLSDEVIEDCLTTRASQNAIEYRSNYYGGPTAVYEAMISSVGFKAFHLNFSNWQKLHPGQKPSDAYIEAFATEVRVLKGGKRVGTERAIWMDLPTPKVSWSMLQKKLTAFREQEGRSPSNKEIAELALPEREWLDDEGGSEYRDEFGRQITAQQFYERIEGDKVDFDAWRNRLQKHRHRTQSYPTVDQAIELSRGWGTVDRTVGILYRWQHKSTNKVYIGITTESLEERVRGHLRTVERGGFSSNGLHADIDKFGVSAFEIHEIERFADLSALAEAERESIIFHNSIFPHGYNLVEGGRGLSLRMLPMSFRGRRYKNMAALADDYAQPVKRVESRLRWGWSMEEAVDLPKGSQRNQKIKQLGTKSLKKYAEENGVSYQNTWARIQEGWSLEEAVGLVERSRVGGKAKSVTVSGTVFRSNAQAARYYGISEGTWRKRIKLGWSPNQAAGIEPPPKGTRLKSVKS